nr:Retrovirus-related Pol polyprotein from transposon TNT 1-94 [Ipomoea batatas]
MEAYLEANDLWDAVKEDYEVPPLIDNPTMAQLKSHNLRKSRKSKAKATLFATVSEEIFTSIMNQKSAFDIWNFLKTGYAGDEKLKGMQKLNLIREFEMQQMKESETIKEYTDKLLSIANIIRLLELNSALQAQEQRRLIRIEGSVEGALQAKLQINHGEKDKKKSSKKNLRDAASSSKGEKKRDFPPCKHCGKKGHPPFKCWKRPDVNVGQLVEKRFKVIFENKLGIIKDTYDNDVIRIKMRGTSFLLDSMEEEQAAYTATTTNTETWDKRLGHFHHAAILNLQKRKLVMAYPTLSRIYQFARLVNLENKLDFLSEKDSGELPRSCNSSIQMLPTKVVDGKTPFEAWYSYKPQVKNLKVFGCLCFTHVPQIKRHKLDKGVEPDIFVAYSLTSNAYRVFQLDTRRILISRDVSFMENDKWSWNNAEIQQPNDMNHDELIDDPPVRGTRLLADIYQRCNVDSVSTPMCLKEKLCRDDGTTKGNESMYRSLIGCLMYLTATRPDIMVHRSTSGFCFNFESGSFTWSSRKQEIVAQSTAEAEFISATAAVNHALWLRKILCDLHLEQKASTEVMVDNQAVIAISNNPFFHGKTKHFSIKLFFIRDVHKGGAVRLKYCKIEDQLADIFTKPLAKGRFEDLRERLGICIH